MLGLTSHGLKREIRHQIAQSCFAMSLPTLPRKTSRAQMAPPSTRHSLHGILTSLRLISMVACGVVAEPKPPAFWCPRMCWMTWESLVTILTSMPHGVLQPWEPSPLQTRPSTQQPCVESIYTTFVPLLTQIAWHLQLNNSGWTPYKPPACRQPHTSS